MTEQRSPSYDEVTHTGTGTDNKVEPKGQNVKPERAPQASENDKGGQSGDSKQ